jgi:hypothetical protein
MLAEGFRPGNVKPSPKTVVSLHAVLVAAGVPNPPSGAAARRSADP